MKAILFDRDHPSPLLMPPEVGLIADSAITAHARPVFVPDFDSEWIAEFYLAVRISRLGKNIAAKFASRYYDAVTVAMRLVPVTLNNELMAARRPNGVASMFDNALTPGLWLATGDVNPAADSVEVTVNEMTSRLSGLDHAIDESVEAVSRYATLKTGDIIMPCRVVSSIGVCTGVMVKCSVSGHDCLDLKLH